MQEARTVAMRRSGTKVDMGPGDALAQLDVLASSMSEFAIKITGGKTLSNIYDILAKGNAPDKNKNVTFSSLSEMQSAIAKGAKEQSRPGDSKTPYDKDGYLKELSRAAIIEAQNLNAGDTFTDSKGNRYKVTDGHDGLIKKPRAVRMAMGGYISRAASGISGMISSQPYLVGERGPELFVPSSGGQIIPNNKLGASYNIPSGGINSVKRSGNNSSSSNTYNIDIKLSGTNVTADDIIRKFKSELALVNAKEGRSRSFGGNY
jgi:hypothetical protein